MSRDADRANPYVGLRPFDRAESLYFFGRREQVAELLNRLHESRFVAVVGSSGCGKSSLVRAGLIPALLGGFLVQDRDRWLVAKMKPGVGPMANLARALCSVGESEPEPGEVARLHKEIIEYDREAVLGHLKPLLGSRANLLLLVDQFEEIFAFRGGDGDEPVAELGRAERENLTQRQREAEEFVDLMLSLSEQSDLPIYVVLTMRSDFLGDCDVFYGLPETMNLSRYLVPRLNRGQLREAIEGPPLLLGQRLASRLVDNLLNELGDRSDRLPILQHALMRTWNFWQEKGGQGAIDLEHYENAGTLSDALHRHADEALRDADIAVTRKIFQCLTDTDLNHRRVRCAASMSELVAVTGAEAGQIEAILRRCNEDGRSFLLLSPTADSSDTLVEISHESLIRQWDRLAGWVDEEREARDQFRELVDRARGGRALLHDVDLRAALDWQARVQPTRAWARRYSNESDDFEVALDYLGRSRIAERRAENRLRRNRYLVVSATAIAGLALSMFALWALDSASRARDTATVGIAHEWMERDPTLAALFLLETRRPDRTRFAAAKMHELLEYPVASNILVGHEKPLVLAVFSPDGSWILTASDDGSARVWSADGTSPTVVLRGHQGPVLAAVFSPDGTRVLTGSEDGTARVWNADGSGEPVVLEGHQGPVVSAAFHRDNERLVTGSRDATARVWSLGAGIAPVVLPHEGEVSTVGFSPDGTRIVTGAEDGVVRIWSSDGSGEAVLLRGHVGSLATASFSPDGTQIVTGASDGTVRIWTGDDSADPVVLGREGSFRSYETAVFSPDGTRVLTMAIGAGESEVRIHQADGSGEPTDFPHELGSLRLVVLSAAFSPDGTRIVTASADGTVRVWNADGLDDPVVLRGHRAAVPTAAFNPDGTRIVSASRDGTARVWNLESWPEPRVLAGHDAWVAAAAFSPDGSRIATASYDGVARIWSVDDRDALQTLEGHDGAIASLSFSPDGTKVVTASDDGNALVWSVGGSTEPIALSHGGPVVSARFGPAGKRIVTGSLDGKARVWSADGRGEPVALAHGRSVTTAGFSPDGSRIATASEDGVVRVWSLDSPATPVVLGGHERPVNSVEFSPDGTRVATASGDDTARVWRSDGSGEPVILEHEGWVSSAVFSPDGTRVLTASDDTTARIWRADGVGSPTVFRGHEGPVFTAVFRPDGGRILTSSSDATARQWSADGSGEPLVLRGHEDRLTMAAFSPDGNRVVTASHDGTARAWVVDADRLQRVIASATRACLVPRIREVYLDESPGDSRRRFEQCERRHGREQ
jgi:WD40 repeat protein